MGLLNVGSLVLGLIAWILPIINLTKYKNPKHNKSDTLTVLSISACAISLFFQITYSNYLVNITDWSALMDTADAVTFASAVLLIGTIILNGISFVTYRNRTIN